MQPLAVRILYVALIAVFGGVSSVAAVGTKRPDGGFEPRLDKLQDLLGYIHTVENDQGQGRSQVVAGHWVHTRRNGRPHHPRARSRPARLALRLLGRLFRLRQ